MRLDQLTKSCDHVAMDSTTDPTHPLPEDCDVVVVGAGLAGLAIARGLRARGTGVRVLEARARTGGRTKGATREDGLRVDLGAQFVSGRHRRVLDLADELGLSVVRLGAPGASVSIAEGTRRVIPRFGRPLGLASTIDLVGALARVWWLLRCSGRRSDPQLQRESAAALISRLTHRRDTEAMLAWEVTQSLCVDPAQVSARELLDQLHVVGGLSAASSGDDLALVGGAFTLCERMGAELGDAVVLGAEVTAIRRRLCRMVVSCADGRSFAARRVVVTVPAHLVARMEIDPPLPSVQRRARARMLRGRVTKTVAVFDRPWWRELGFSGKVANRRSIYQEMIDASEMDPQGRGLLVAFSAAERADQIERLTLEERRLRLLADLNEAFGSGSRPPTALFSEDWANEPYSEGCYASRLAPGDQDVDLGARHDLVHFAGTETARSWRSFMEGALESAERVLDEIDG
jgi:monoamine oxidase